MMTVKILKILPLAAIGIVGAFAGLALNSTHVEAATISQTVSQFNFFGSPPYPNPSQTVGTYSFSIPSGEQIASAVINGTFGNSAIPNTSGVEVFFNGLNVATCTPSQPCYSNQSPTAWSFTFDPSQFSLFSTGSGVLTSVQTSDFTTRLGATTLTLETAPIAIPTPALLPGLIGMGVAALRKRKAEAVEESSEA